MKTPESLSLDKTTLIDNNRFSFFKITHCGTMVQINAPYLVQIESSITDCQSYKLSWFGTTPPFDISPEDLNRTRIDFILINHNTSQIYNNKKKPIYIFLAYRYGEYDFENYEYRITFDTGVTNFYLIRKIETMLLESSKPFISDMEEPDMNTERGVNYSTYSTLNNEYELPLMKEVIFNEPYTIVKWIDGKITKVGCKDGEVFDKELGLCAAIARRYFESINSACPRKICRQIIRHAKHFTNKKPDKKLLPAAENEETN